MQPGLFPTLLGGCLEIVKFLFSTFSKFLGLLTELMAWCYFSFRAPSRDQYPWQGAASVRRDTWGEKVVEEALIAQGHSFKAGSLHYLRAGPGVGDAWELPSGLRVTAVN